MRSLILLSTALVAGSVQAASLSTLQGDAEAVRRIELMYEQLGGRERWAAARSMTIEYRQLSSAGRPGEGVEYAWRDLTRPRERLEWVRTHLTGQRFNFGRGNDETRGWRRLPDGTVEIRTSDALKGIVDFWRRDFYTMFRRMAIGDPDIRLAFTPPNRIAMTDAAGGAIGWWEIDERGWLLQWGTTDTDGKTPFSWFYGPYKKYGEIAFPAWGVSGDGLIRFEYTDFRISAKPFPEEVLLDPSKPPSPNLLKR